MKIQNNKAKARINLSGLRCLLLSKLLSIKKTEIYLNF
jgi:hypothetical protein